MSSPSESDVLEDCGKASEPFVNINEVETASNRDVEIGYVGTSLGDKNVNLDDNKQENVMYSKRDRKLTTKGYQYTITKLYNDRQSAFSRFCKQFAKVNEMLSSLDDVSNEDLSEAKDVMVSNFKIFDQANREYMKLLAPEDPERKDCHRWFESQYREYNRALNIIERKTTNGSICGKSERGSSVKSTSSIKSILLMQAEAAVKKSTIEAELNYLPIENEAAIKLKQIQLSKRLAVAEAEHRALSQLSEDAPIRPAIVIPEIVPCFRPPPPVTTEMYIRPNLNAPIFTPSFQRNSVDVQTQHTTSDMPLMNSSTTRTPRQPPHRDRLLDLVESIVDIQRKSTLPPEDLLVFSGNVIEFPSWIKDFENLIESSVRESRQRLRYLTKYTSGEARECISGISGIDSEDAYFKAKQLLVDWYGNPLNIASTYQKKLMDWPVISMRDKGIFR